MGGHSLHPLPPPSMSLPPSISLPASLASTLTAAVILTATLTRWGRQCPNDGGPQWQPAMRAPLHGHRPVALASTTVPSPALRYIPGPNPNISYNPTLTPSHTTTPNPKPQPLTPNRNSTPYPNSIAAAGTALSSTPLRYNPTR